jgi:hypothetical protein
MTNGHADVEGLAFFNRLSGRLTVTLNEEPGTLVPLSNLVASPAASLVSVSLRWQVFESGAAFRELSDGEWQRVVVRVPAIRMRDAMVSDVVVEHASPNGAVFTVRDLAEAVEVTERRVRPEAKWFGGIDVHHVFFEGIHLDDSGAWAISWGS